MAVIEINRNPSERELRWFALMVPVFLGVVGGLLWRSDARLVAQALWAAGAVLGIVCAASRTARRPIYLAWMYLAYPIGWVVSHVLLGAIYYGMITPIGLMLRATGHDPMQYRRDPSTTSFWAPHNPGGDVSRYFKQF